MQKRIVKIAFVTLVIDLVEATRLQSTAQTSLTETSTFEKQDIKLAQLGASAS